MFQEYPTTLIYQQTDNTRAQISNLFIGIIYHIHNTLHMVQTIIIKEVQQQLNGFIGRQYMQFTGIFYIHNLITDIIGRFNKINQRITGKLIRILRVTFNTQFCGNTQIRFFFRLKETEFSFLSGLC